MFSSGIASWAAAKRWAERYGTDGLVLLFADTKIEDEDNYRFLHEAAENVGGELVIIEDGRNPFEVMKDERMIGNTRYDPCSKILKRKLMDKWRAENVSPDTPIIYGLNWDEQDRLERMKERMPETNFEAPLTWAPYMTKADIFNLARTEGITRPRMYDMGFPHANCGGFCVKAGVANFKLLLREFPERYADAEKWEKEMQEYLNVDHTILRKTENGVRRNNLSLRELRESIEAGEALQNEFDFGGCACALPI